MPNRIEIITVKTKLNEGRVISIIDGVGYFQGLIIFLDDVDFVGIGYSDGLIIEGGVDGGD